MRENYGRKTHWVDATPVRDHVNRLREFGMGTPTIARVAGVHVSVVQHLIWGRPYAKLEPAQNIHKLLARRLLRVEPKLANCSPMALVSGVGPRRRLQGLIADGWSPSEIARHLDVDKVLIHRYLKADRVAAKTAIEICKLSEALANVDPPRATRYDKQNYTKAKNSAVRHGWVTALAWDDIDDPDEEAPAGYQPRKGNERFDWDDVEHFRRFGMSDARIANSLGVSVNTIKDYERRRRNDAAA
ncbi:helix-turn-helix domain-containing protein [Amycolatopsis kentuckyensis]|uniref:helix-turn-helix domain-containing protein n=1 Tax=Amycolatopsis kentuckyensis TaxID=218823 RepID=UPI000A39A305|nr:helix-turn-helix domain-containing protein [Amycolatopsis kentuckyensis]